ncbi:hypothetical protein [Paeniglutamicibacter psychrophenolicus]|uniref:Uncharacterized protein n=1 Tax=Paeniglutamicibacter psychrophenolicus TaxID=257454 RepID=A0ABS4W7N6_9MICC|nr:hypothetical protein [Paeniglutamicibacter psychrophenolicus]MBP2372209.1 hypothetical protein [Paeniglutamicibacter psychrophenolicus]
MVIEALAEGLDSCIKNLEVYKETTVKNPFLPTVDGRPILPTRRNDIREAPLPQGAVSLPCESPAFGVRLHRSETP